MLQVDAFVLLVQPQLIQNTHRGSACQISGRMKLETSSAKTDPDPRLRPRALE